MYELYGKIQVANEYKMLKTCTWYI